MTPPIPFRTESAVSAGSYGVAFAVTVSLLILVACGLVVARRRGWTSISPRSGLALDGAALVHLSSKRIGPSVTLHIVQCEGHRYMIVEAGRGVQTSVVPLPEARDLRGESS